MLVRTKKWYTSKLFWLGVVVTLLAGVDYIDALDLPAAERILTILGPLIIALRYWTKQPITVSGKTEARSITGGVPLGRE